MYLTARRVGLLGALVVAMLVLATPALADPGEFVNCEQHPTAPECVLDPSVPGSPGDDGGTGGSAAECRDSGGRVVPCYIEGKGWYGGDGCWYQPATGNDLAAAEALGGKAVPPDRWYIGSCGDPLTNFWPAGLVTFRLYGGQGPSLDLLADQAVRRLRLPAPVIRVNPAPPAPQVVFVPTWLWVDSSSWGERSATASAGGLSVTATAKPTKVKWSTGDGATVTCNGPGTPWKKGTDPKKTSTCGHTYTRPAPTGGTYPVSATVTWEITWSGGGESGTRPALTTTAEAELRVVEAGALNSNGAG
ncbi:hypothetical protein WEI85_00315 [Actinomycetes bacterium KLBMP 9797]